MNNLTFKKQADKKIAKWGKLKCIKFMIDSSILIIKNGRQHNPQNWTILWTSIAFIAIIIKVFLMIFGTVENCQESAKTLTQLVLPILKEKIYKEYFYKG